MKNGHYPSDSQGRRPAPQIARLAPKWPAAGILALLALALAGVLLWSAPAQAQTETVLVKNTGQTAQSSTFQLSTAATKRTQAFTTGSHSAGYTLNSIGLSFGDIAEITTAGAQLTVTLNEVSGGDPGSVLCTLTDPATFTGAGVQTFDAPAADPCPTLKARTTYFAVIERVVFPNPDTSISLQITTSGDEDSGGAMGWTIGDARQFFGSGTWTQTAFQSHLIEVRGTEAPYQPKRVTSFDLGSDNSDPRGMWGNEDTFWVVNDASPNGAGDKLFAYNRSDGSRDSANDFDNLDGADNNSPWGICSDGTTMFVGDRGDDKLYAYKMSDTNADSTNDITLDSDNGEPRGMWCDATTVYVANDGATSANKVFAYTISSGAHDSSKDFEELYLSTNTAAQNAETPRGVWSNGATMFVADSDDDNVFAYKHSDESQDSAKNLALSDNDNTRGMWFDGRVLWVVDGTDDRLYPYDLPGAQPDNTPADGDPRVGSAFTKDVFTATVTAAVSPPPPPGQNGYAVAGIFLISFGSISETQFTLEGVTYTVRAVLDENGGLNTGDLILELDKKLPRGFTFTADGVSYSSDDATESEPGTGRYRYQWSASLSYTLGSVIPVVLSVETPKDGVEVTADVSGITDSTDGVANASFQYQWIRVDGTDETDIGAVGATYTPTADDVDKHLKVRVVFDDDAGNEEYPLTSPRFGPVVEGVPPTLLGAAATAATTINVTFSEPLDPNSVPAASAFVVQVGGTAGPVDSAEFHPDSEDAIRLTVSTPLLSRDTITLSYAKPDGNPLQDPNRNEVESFTGQPVVNLIRETFVSNLGQTTSLATGNLATDDFAQRFDTGSTASFDFTEVEVLFDTAPSSSATVTAVIADGLNLSNNIVATLTNPLEWSANARFGIPSGTTLSKDTTYYLIIEGTDGILQTTTSNAEDSGAAANWTIGNAASIRTDETQSSLGGTWTGSPSASLQMAIRGKHHGRPGTPELAVTAKDQTLILDVTVPDHGSSNLTDIEYSYKATTGGAYTSWAPVTGGTVSNSGGTFEIGGLDNGTEYTAQVQTVNDIGTSDPSNEEKATPDAPPAITMVAITSDPGTDKTYDIGDDIVVTFTFDKNIEFSGIGTAPNIYLYIGTEEEEEEEPGCAIGTAPTMALFCTHTVEEGEEDSDGIRVGPTIEQGQKRVVGPLDQYADLTHSGLAEDSDHKVDGVRPELTGARASADKTKITLTFSEAIGAVDRTKITFDSGGTTLTHTAHSTTGSEVEITLTNALGAMDTNVTVELAADAVEDAVGNGNAVLPATSVKLVDEIWSATLTVKDLGSNFLGCATQEANKGCEPGELLTDNTFSYDSVDYTIGIIDLGAGALGIETNANPFNAAALADLTLNVGSASFPFADASHSQGQLIWTSTGLTWSEDDMIALSIDADPPPMLVTAQVETATTLALIFDQGLDSSSRPATSAFAVTVNGSSRSVSSAAFNTANDGLVLTVGSAISPGDAVVVSYTKPANNPLQDAAGNETESFTEELENLLRDTLVSNLGQTSASGVVNLSNNDASQAFTTGPTVDAYTFTGVKVLFSTVPTASATVSAFIADGLTTSDNVVANLTNPDTWSATSTFGIPSGTTLAANTTYYLIIEGSDGTLHRAASNNEDTGAVTGWSIADTSAARGASSSGLGGTWTPQGVKLQIAVEGIHKGIPGIPDLSLSAKDQAITLEVEITDHGREDLTDIEYRYKATTGGTYTEWTSVTESFSNTGGTFEIGGLTNGTDYTVQVQGVNDSGDGLPSSEETATPDAPPKITGVAITSAPGTDKTYAIDDEIEVTFTFDKNIELSGTGFPPVATFMIGTESWEPDCAVGTAPTMVMTCTHTVAAGDEDTDGIEVIGNGILEAQQRIVGPLGQRAVLTHSALAEDSDHKVDGVRPELTGARASADKTKITLTFSEAIGAVDRTKITFDSGGTTLTTTAHSITGSEVEITLTNALGATDTNVTVALAADAVEDAVDNGNAVLAATAIVDETAPTLSETSTPSNTEVLLTYNEPLDPDSIPGTSAFTVLVNTGTTARTISTATLSGTSGILLTLSPAFRPGDLLTVSYTVPTLNPIRDIAENEAAALSSRLVDNTLPATAPDMPGSLAANFNLISFLPPLEFNADLMDISWTAPWPNGSPIEKFQYRYAAGPIWSATLTVKDLGSNFLGCDSAETNKGCQPGELLTDRTFSYDSTSYRIDTIDLIGGQLRLQTGTVIPASALAELALQVGTTSLPFADATQSLSTLTWTGTGLSWSEDDAVPLSIRSFTAWTDVPDSAPGGANHTSYTVSGLDVDTGYTFEVRAKNGIDFGTAASVTKRTRGVLWSFTLRDGTASDVTELTEGGDSATARVTITNDSRFSTDQEITLEWGGFSLEDGRIQGAGNTSTITITAGASTGQLDLSAPDNEVNPVYFPLETADLTATWEGAVIGTITDLRRIDDESPPVARITDAPLSVNEGDSFDIDIAISVRYPNPGVLRFTITDSDSALSGTLPNQELLIAGTLTATVTLTAAENTTQNDGARTVTFTLETSTDIPYTLGTGTEKTVTIIVRDDDTPPLAVGNLRAQAGNTEATLRWQAPAAPTPDHGQPILHYEYRVKVGTGSFGTWTMVPNSDGTTTSHKFTGLTNETEYTYEVRAENVAGDGAEADVSVTPRVGVAVSFGAATASITEGGSSAVTLTLDEAPDVGTTVTVPITAMRGDGLGATEYSGVPASVTFVAGDTSKSFTVSVADDALDEPDEELTLELGTLPSGYVPGTNAEIVITVVDDDVAEWGLTLTGSNGSAVTELTEGGASATARVSITNSVRFETDQTITLEWGGQEITGGLIQGAGGSATITITAGQSNGTLAVSAPQRPGDRYRPPETGTLTAMLGEAQIGGGIELKYVDDEDPPVLTISLRDARVVEGDSVFLDGTLSRGYDTSGPPVPLRALATGATTRIPQLAQTPVNGQPAAAVIFSPGQTTSLQSSMTPTGNTTAGDHATIVFTIPSNPDHYTIGTPSTATLLILDDDAAPGAPRNPTARPGDTEATLGWDHPSTYDQIWVSDYQYRQRAGTGPWTGWAALPDSDGETTGHTFTGLTNDIEYTFEIRGRNSNHNGAVAQVMVTPREGPAVLLSTETLQVDEGGSGAYSVVLAIEPTAPVTIIISRGGDVTTQPNTLRFTASNWNIWQRVTVNAAQDGDADDDTVAITHTVSGGSAAEYVALTDAAIVQVTVVDDDVPPPPVRGLTAADESQDAVALSWWSERGAAEYELEYRKQGDTGNWTRVTRGDFDHLPSTSGNRSLTAVATGLDCNTTYDFRIRLRGSGDILLNAFGPPTEASQKTGQCAQPDRPSNLMYTLAPDCATLTWTAPTGGDYTGVRISRLTLGDDNYTLIHESLNSRPTSYRDCTHTGDGYGDGDNPWYAYHVTYIKSGSRGIVESKPARSGMDQYGPAFQDHRHAAPRNVRLTRDTDSQRRMSWETPPSWSLTTWAGLQGANVPVRDPWITGYVVERREFRARADGYLYFSDAEEDLSLWSATMTVGDSGGTELGYVEGSYGGLTPTGFTLSSGRHRVNALHGGNTTLQLSIAPIPPGDALEDWVLVLDGDPLPFKDGNIDPSTATNLLLVTWVGLSLNWANGQQVSVQLVDRDRYGWKTVREGNDGNTSTSFTDNEQANGRKFVYRIMSTNKYGTSTTHSIFDWLWDSPYRDAVIDLAATDTTTDDETSGSANSPASGAPTIDGTPRVGETLTASTSAISDQDGLTRVSYSYQWNKNDAGISGATGPTYTLTADEKGLTIQVRVTFTDDEGNAESLTSAATGAVLPPAPLTATFPVSPYQSARHKGGDDRPQVIVAFSLTVASFEKTTPSVSLTGATVSSVRRHQEDGLENAWIFFLDPDDNHDIVFNLLTGQSCDSGGICTDDGRRLSSAVQTTLPGPDEEAETDNPTPDAPNSPATGAPTISGTPQVEQTLTANTSAIQDADGLQNVNYQYQWMAGGAAISGATGTSYTLTTSQQGDTIQVRVNFTDDDGNSETLTSVATDAVAAAEQANNAPTGLPSISGTAQVGETLTASTSNIDDQDGLDDVSYSYQWVRNDGTDDTDIAGETSSTYTLVDADQGQTIRVKVTFTDDAGNDESLTSAATETVLARPNRAAAGLPTISGTPQVEQTLTADTSGISDEDGLSNVSYTYQWIAGGADIDGATGASYTLTADEEGDTIQVRVTFTDDADNAETLTSVATVAVAAAPVPLTAEFQDLPDSHDGSATFIFQVLFSEDVGISYVNMRDDAFSVSDGDVTGARRVNGRNDLWEITVEPDDNSDVGITLPANRSCSTAGAICTKEDTPRQLTNSPSATVPGPDDDSSSDTTEEPTATSQLSVADATASEEDDSTIDFVVTLNPASEESVTVDYATANGTASSGSDYTAASGSITFAAGETSRTITVAIIDDSTEEDDETLTLTLSNPSGAEISDGVATGTITDSEPIPLTATFSNVPASHDGSTEFTFDLTFSEEFGISYATLRDHAFSITGGSVEAAQRTDKPSNISWRITVKPLGNGTITITLPETTDCNADGAICTDDGRKLSNSTTVTVAGPE